MGSCNCKNGGNLNDLMSSDITTSKTEVLIKYTLKVIGFLLLLIMLPIINIWIIWMMFDMLVLNRNIDIKPALLALARKFQIDEVDYDDEDEISEEEFLNLTEDNVVLMNSEDLNTKEHVK